MMAERKFENQVAVITGAGSGIGFEIARQLCLQGAKVVLNDIDPRKAEEAAASIQSQGGTCQACPGNSGDMATIEGLVQRAVSDFGQLDLCIANAGITRFGEFLEFSPDQFRELMSVNLFGSFFLCQSAARHMRDRGEGGKILIMSSVVGVRPYPELSAYSMTKAALQMLTRSLALEISPYQINVNSLAPGATLTDRTLLDDPHYEEHWRDLVPLGRPAQTKDIAQAALFLLSPQAAHITGQIISLDGGWSQVGNYPPVHSQQSSSKDQA
jgi:glucose 1-dehydrogenase